LANQDVEKSSYGGFERFLFFVTPILFTVILLGVLLALFNYDIRNSLLEFGNKIPIVSSFLPEPAPKPEESEVADPEAVAKASADKVNELNQIIAAKDAELKKVVDKNAKSEQTIKSLQDQMKSLEEKLQQKTVDDAAYDQQVQGLASVYAKIAPSKAAPIIENLTIEEQVLVLSAMKTDERVKILEKMNPKKAADASILLKDVTTSKDREIAALQSRLNLKEAATPPAKSTVDKKDLGETFGNMAPKNAASLLLEMNKISQDKVLAILSTMSNQNRSAVLGAMADQDKSTAAKLTTKLAAK